MPKFAVLILWSDGEWELKIDEGRNAEEVHDYYEHNQNYVIVFRLSEFLKKLVDADVIRHMHEEHVL